MRLFITGGTGVLGRALQPVARAAGHELVMPGHDQLDLFVDLVREFFAGAPVREPAAPERRTPR